MPKPHSILIVDDDEQFLEEAKSALPERSYQIYTASSGKEALSISRKTHPEIVLMDKKLPDIDGQELIRYIHKASKDSSFIIITAYGDMESAIKGISDESIADYMLKPVSFDKLLGAIKKALKLKAASRKRLNVYRKKYYTQHRKYKTLFDNAKDAIFIADAEDGSIVECNKAASDLSGYSQNELIGKPAIFLHPGEHWEASRQLLNSYKKNEVVSEEMLIQHKRGKKIPVLVTAAPFRIGSKTYVQSIFTDLSDIKKIEQKIHKSEERYGHIVNIVPGIVYIASLPDLSTIYVNEKVSDLLGFSQAEFLTGKCTFPGQLYTDDKDKVQESIRHAAKTGGLFECVCRLMHKDGKTLKWFKNLAVVVRDEEKDKQMLYGFMLDITDVKIGQDEHEKLSRMAKNISEGVFVTSNGGTISYANAAAERIFGHKCEELIGKMPSVFMSEANPPGAFSAIEDCIKQGMECQEEVIGVRKDKSSFPALIRIDPLKDEKGSIKGSIGVITDITEKRLLETELKRYAQHLENLVDKKTRDLSQTMRELQAANKKLNKKTGQQSQFMADVAKELLGPLEHISKVMKNAVKQLGAEQRPGAHEALFGSSKELDRLARFSRNILDLSKIELGKIGMERAEIPLKEMFSSLIGSFKALFDDKKVSFEADIADTPPAMWGDRALLEKVFTTLIDNALRYTPPGKSVQIKVFSPDESLRFEIIDQGCGISDDMSGRIFDKFKRIFNENVNGKGLDLAISREIVELHKGNITVESEKDKGTRFVVIIPLDFRKG